MTYPEWKSGFVDWHAQRNAVLVEAKSSMDMLDELQQRYERADDETREWMVQLFREWRESGDEFQSYDGRAMLNWLTKQ